MKRKIYIYSILYLCLGCVSVEYFPNKIESTLISESKISSPKKSSKYKQNGIFKSIVIDGIIYKGTVDVSNVAFERSKKILDFMLSEVPKVRKELQEIKFSIVIFPPNLKITDMPEYADFKGQTFHQRTQGLRTEDSVQGQTEFHLSSTSEKNLLGYFVEGHITLAHEMAHAIHKHLSREDVDDIRRAYINAVKKRIYPMSHYIMENSYEYWAVASESWLNTTRLTDHNGGFETRDKIKSHDPELAKILEMVYGSRDLILN